MIWHTLEFLFVNLLGNYNLIFMKKSIIVFVLLVIGLISCNTKEKNQEEVTEDTELNFTDEHTAQNSLDWMGEYEGVLPCADCEGIRTIVVLNENGTFTSKQIY